jgi:hypothetical protein
MCFGVGRSVCYELGRSVGLIYSNQVNLRDFVSSAGGKMVRNSSSLWLQERCFGSGGGRRLSDKVPKIAMKFFLGLGNR